MKNSKIKTEKSPLLKSHLIWVEKEGLSPIKESYIISKMVEEIKSNK